MDTILPSRPLNYIEIIKRSLLLYRHGFSKIVWIALLLSIIVFIPQLLSAIAQQDIFLNLPPLSPHRLWMVLINLVSLAFFVAILWHLYCVARNLHEPLIEDMVMGLKKALLVFIAAIIQSAILFAVTGIIFGLQLLLYQYNVIFSGSIMSVVITGLIFIGQFLLILYMSVLFVFFVPLIAIENKGILTSIEKSVLLAWNHWWRVFSVQLTPWVCYLLLLALLRYGLHSNMNIYFFEPTPSLWLTLLNILIFALLIPWVAAVLVVQLKELEIRRKVSHKQ